jgi:hypothetical protein
MKLNRPKLFEVNKIFSMRQWKSQSTTNDNNNQTEREKNNEFENGQHTPNRAIKK